MPNENVIGWRELETLAGDETKDKVLEVRILSQPLPFLRHSFDGKDNRGVVYRVGFYSDEVPPGMALGKVMRWKSPRLHYFMDGSKGARIEDEDVANITIV